MTDTIPQPLAHYLLYTLMAEAGSAPQMRYQVPRRWSSNPYLFSLTSICPRSNILRLCIPCLSQLRPFMQAPPTPEYIHWAVSGLRISPKTLQMLRPTRLAIPTTRQPTSRSNLPCIPTRCKAPQPTCTGHRAIAPSRNTHSRSNTRAARRPCSNHHHRFLASRKTPPSSQQTIFHSGCGPTATH